MSKMQRTKGKSGERQVVNLLRLHGISSKRISPLETNGVDKGDVLVGDVIAQVKLGSHVPIFLYKALENCEYLFTRRDREKWLVTMPIEKFFSLLEKQK